jgi:hypothetical protein
MLNINICEGDDIMEELINEYINSLRKLDAEQYAFNTILTAIAPSICEIKCGSLVNITDKNKNMKSVWKESSSEFLQKLKLSYVVVKEDKERVLIYFYNKKLLSQMLRDDSIRSFLKGYGYENCSELKEVLTVLKNRFMQELPHEIGIFLGIPLQDVKGFISNKGKNHLYCGYWKVYGDVESGIRIFSEYTSLRRTVIEDIASGCGWLEILKHLKEIRDAAALNKL